MPPCFKFIKVVKMSVFIKGSLKMTVTIRGPMMCDCDELTIHMVNA